MNFSAFDFLWLLRIDSFFFKDMGIPKMLKGIVYDRFTKLLFESISKYDL